MQPHRIVSEREWLAERQAYLQKIELSRQRRELPWVKVHKHYLFEGPRGRETLTQLFEGRSQLIVYHVAWAEGALSGSDLASQLDSAREHLAQNDVTLVAISRTPLVQIEALRRRLGWEFKWLSCAGSEIGRDSCVSFIDDLVQGASVFYKDEWGDVFRTNSLSTRAHFSCVAGATEAAAL